MMSLKDGFFKEQGTHYNSKFLKQHLLQSYWFGGLWLILRNMGNLEVLSKA